MPQALIGLGSNLGPCFSNVEQAAVQLGSLSGTSLQARSKLHITQPIGGPAGQGDFINAAAVIQTSASPSELLTLLEGVEIAFGRQRGEHWAERTLDLDLLLYGGEVVQTPALSVPHPRMSFRPFVLDPAVEIAGDWWHPLLLATLDDLHRRLHRGDDALVIYGGSEADRRWHAEWLCETFTDLAIAQASDQETLIAIEPSTAHEDPRLAIQLQTADEPLQFGVPTLSIPATGREEVAFDTEAAVEAVWPDLCRQRAGE